MNKHYKISKSDIEERYKKKSHNGPPLSKFAETVEDLIEVFNLESIPHLSNNTVEVYAEKENYYWLCNRKKDMNYVIREEEVRPKSIREALSNIEKAKEFYEK